MDQLAGKAAVITGAGSGMGKAFAARFAAEGMKIAAADIQQDTLAATVSELTAAGHEVIGIQADVSDAGPRAALPSPRQARSCGTACTRG